MQFGRISAKIQPKNLNLARYSLLLSSVWQHFDWGGKGGRSGPPLATSLSSGSIQSYDYTAKK